MMSRCGRLSIVDMPAELDPVWEYFTPDPEVEEVVYARRACGLDVLYDPEVSYRGANPGFRVGRGNPNHGAYLRLARPRPVRDREGISPRPCPSCGRVFTPMRRARVCCSKRCARLVYWDGRCGADGRPVRVACGECGVEFAPLWPGHRLCSRACASAAGARVSRKEVPDGFAEMYARGVPMKDLEAWFGVRKCQLKRWRRKLGLPARPTGRPPQLHTSKEG